ncbi:MAG TPA: VOC family protein [Polyangiaceae bacterium]|nr:VOC family protein [Polyangiaceae bacterium]
MDLARTHILLGVDDAGRATAFYEALLGAPPAIREEGVTIFESDAPPLVLTLQKRATRTAGAGRNRTPAPRGAQRGAMPPARERFALVVPEPEHVGKAAVALWRAGAPLRLKDQGIEAEDPDGNAWQVRFVPYAKARAVIAVPVEEPHEGR